jgi:hypothetical protein
VVATPLELDFAREYPQRTKGIAAIHCSGNKNTAFDFHCFIPSSSTNMVHTHTDCQDSEIITILHGTHVFSFRVFFENMTVDIYLQRCSGLIAQAPPISLFYKDSP